MPANRIVALTSAVIVLLLGLLPVVADADWTTTAGCIAAIVGLLGVTLKWLEGWQAHEARQALPEVVAEVAASTAATGAHGVVVTFPAPAIRVPEASIQPQA